MAEENRIATHEWLYQNLLEFKKVVKPPNDKKGCTKSRLISNYNVDETLLTAYDNNRLIPRGKCIGVDNTIDIDMPIGVYNANTLDKFSDDSLVIAGGSATLTDNLTIVPISNTNYKTIIKIKTDWTVDETFTDNLKTLTNPIEVQKIFTFSNNNIIVMGVQSNNAYKMLLLNSTGSILNNNVLASIDSIKFINCSVNKSRNELIGIIRTPAYEYRIVRVSQTGVVTIDPNIITAKIDAVYQYDNGNVLISGGKRFSYKGTTSNEMGVMLISPDYNVLKNFTNNDFTIGSNITNVKAFRSRITTIVDGLTDVPEVNIMFNRTLNGNIDSAVSCKYFIESNGYVYTNQILSATTPNNDNTAGHFKNTYSSLNILNEDSTWFGYLKHKNSIDSYRTNFTDNNPSPPHLDGIVNPVSDNIQVGDYLIRVVNIKSKNEIKKITNHQTSQEYKYLGFIKLKLI